MYKKIITLTLFILGTASVLPAVAFANHEKVSDIGEHIKSFDTVITVQEDRSIQVQERIVYDFGNEQRRGIIRSIPSTKVVGSLYPIELSNIVVWEEAGEYQHPFAVEYISSSLTDIRIGDPNVFLTGEVVYDIRYTASNAVGIFDEFDELYWNSVGGQWDVPILSASTTVVFPAQSVNGVELVSYCGYQEEDTSCGSPQMILGDRAVTASVVLSSENQTLGQGRGMTIALKFPKGIVEVPSPKEYQRAFFDAVWVFLVPFLLTLFIFRKRIRSWNIRRRFFRDKPIIAEYDTPEFDALQVAFFMNSRIHTKDISAHILELAIKGFLIISKDSDGKYFFQQTSKNTENLPEHSMLILKSLGGKKESDISQGTMSIFAMEHALTKAKDGTTKTPFQAMNKKFSSSGGKAFVLLFLAINPGAFFWVLGGWKIGLVFSATMVLSAILHLIFRRSKKYISPEELETERKLLGLKKYIAMAEADRIAFHNAPEKNPSLFEKFLPFAIVFNLEKKWEKEFKDIYQTVSPEWFVAQGGTIGTSTFSGIAAVSEISNSLNSMVKDITHIPSSSGGASSSSSSGSSSGSSGGGGGGGGGSSW